MGRRPQDSRAKQEVIAIVDIGSTAVRFLLARITAGLRYRVLAEERVPTRLGGGAPGTLPREAIEETLKAVHRFFSRYSPNAWGPRVVAVATSAVRDARNPERLLGPLRRKEGIDVQVLSAKDEAKLGVDAALASIHLRAHRGERKHRHGLSLQQSDITAIRERLEALSRGKRRKIRGLKAERADIILAGAIVIEETMVFGGYLRLVICTRGVRDGILLRETFNARG